MVLVLIDELGQQLRTLALRDSLTGLCNRRGLKDAASERSLADCSLLMMDLDHFKAVNDDFMTSQYEAQKLDFVKKLLSYLINSNLNAVEPQTFFLVQQLMEQYYPAHTHRLSDQPEARRYAEILAAASAGPALPVVQEPGADYGKK